MDAINKTVKKEGPFNPALKNAIRYLKSMEKIKIDKDIVEKTGYNKATVSEYIRGITKASPEFEREFEEKFGISLADFKEAKTINPSHVLSAAGVNITLQDYIDLLHRENDRLFTILNSTLGQIQIDQQRAERLLKLNLRHIGTVEALQKGIQEDVVQEQIGNQIAGKDEDQ